MFNKPQKHEILQDRQRTSGPSLQATWDTQHSEFHTCTEVCVCPEESLVTYGCSIAKMFKSVFATQNNYLWAPWRLTWDRFVAKSAKKSFWTQPVFCGWLHKGEDICSKWALPPCPPQQMQPVPMGHLCPLWATKSLSDCSSRALSAHQGQLPTDRGVSFK